MRIVLSTLSVLLLVCIFCNASAKISGHCLVKGNDTVTLLAEGKIGFTTKTDTITYGHRDGLWYEIVSITTDSIVVRRPSAYRDTVVKAPRSLYYDIPAEYVLPEYRIVDYYRENKTRVAELVLISQYEYKYFKVSDITSFQYPPEIDESTGCIFCVLVPWTYYKLSKRWQPRDFNMKRWQLVATVKRGKF